MPLKHIPSLISPQLLRILAEMGHGDTLTIADGNFPAHSTAAHTASKQCVDLSGHSGTDVLKAILYLFPLDQYVDKPMQLMDRVDSDKRKNLPTPIWDEYQSICANAEGKDIQYELVERFQFYKEANKSYAVVATGESAQYANIILRKGVITADQQVKL